MFPIQGFVGTPFVPKASYNQITTNSPMIANQRRRKHFNMLNLKHNHPIIFFA
jgi:hypothetical protein